MDPSIDEPFDSSNPSVVSKFFRSLSQVSHHTNQLSRKTDCCLLSDSATKAFWTPGLHTWSIDGWVVTSKWPTTDLPFADRSSQESCFYYSWVAFLYIRSVTVNYTLVNHVLPLKGWYIITYALGIYYLNMLIAFLTPKIDPAIYDDFEGQLLSVVPDLRVLFADDGPSLPTNANEEFRPFIRRLPEFKFWWVCFGSGLGLIINPTASDR